MLYGKREWLSRARRKKKISAEAMAEALDFSISGYYYVESGKRQKRLSLDIASRIAEMLGMTLDEVMEEERKREIGREQRT